MPRRAITPPSSGCREPNHRSGPTSERHGTGSHGGRDGGCRYPGCDAPPPWCDIAHATARRDRGPLTIHNALRLCRHHHRKLDLGRWTITIDGPDATFTHPTGRTIRAGPARGRPPDTS
ncbi:HNH endonuclease signature motif containing protein [Nitriliruptor alkaliphilus]|uniref:HNH endonuclease signature motif containing protein n=1 Tax=Nitriliruptor alkaliphilus TaxID=427918 RepID=UPI000697761F|nr:HNH endonuclease signature motif containing protein [Nitriliruptor alkaliphilus]